MHPFLCSKSESINLDLKRPSSNFILPFGDNKGQQGYGPRPFYSHSNFPLMFGTISSNSSRYDLAPVGYIILQDKRLFVFNSYIRVCTKATKFSLVVKFLLRS